MKLVLAGILLLGLAACGHMPESYVTTSDDRPSLVILGPPAHAVVQVNGNTVGTTGQSPTKEMVIDLTPGRSHVIITASGSRIYDREVFVQDSTQKEIDLR